MKEELKITLSPEKTHITHIVKGIPFLGHIIGRRTVFTKQKYGSKILKRRMKIPTLDVDMSNVIARLATSGYCDKSGNPRPNFKLLQYPQSETNRNLNYVLRGLGE